MKFRPEEILFSPTTKCNLRCLPCTTEKSSRILSEGSAIRFLRECRRHGIETVGFTGGEPFLALDFLVALVRSAVLEGMVFDRIMTNGVWFRSAGELVCSLRRLRRAGYDGSICVSVDAFHRQNLSRLSAFIKTASALWEREDLISITYIGGAREDETGEKLRKLSRLLKARLIGFGSGHAVMRGESLFVKIFEIALSPIGKAALLKDPWDGKWFKEDWCQGPGNAFHILPDGSVKPCCGYAVDLEGLTVGNIARDSFKEIVGNVRENRFVRTVFRSGLAQVRRRLERLGIRFPGKTSSHCFFCHWILKEIPKRLLDQCLD